MATNNYDSPTIGKSLSFKHSHLLFPYHIAGQMATLPLGILVAAIAYILFLENSKTNVHNKYWKHGWKKQVANNLYFL